MPILTLINEEIDQFERTMLCFSPLSLPSVPSCLVLVLKRSKCQWTDFNERQLVYWLSLAVSSDCIQKNFLRPLIVSAAFDMYLNRSILSFLVLYWSMFVLVKYVSLVLSRSLSPFLSSILHFFTLDLIVSRLIHLLALVNWTSSSAWFDAFQCSTIDGNTSLLQGTTLIELFYPCVWFARAR